MGRLGIEPERFLGASPGSQKATRWKGLAGDRRQSIILRQFPSQVKDWESGERVTLEVPEVCVHRRGECLKQNFMEVLPPVEGGIRSHLLGPPSQL